MDQFFDNVTFEDMLLMLGITDEEGGLGTDDALRSMGASEAAAIPQVAGAASVSPGMAPPPLSGGASTPFDPLGPGPQMSPEAVGAELSAMLQQRDAKRRDDSLAYQTSRRAGMF